MAEPERDLGTSERMLDDFSCFRIAVMVFVPPGGKFDDPRS